VIKYDLPDVSTVMVKVYTLVGKEVATLVNEPKEAGSYELQFDASRLSSGIYFYRMIAGNFSQTKRLLLIK
jgi:hypothetical protein